MSDETAPNDVPKTPPKKRGCLKGCLVMLLLFVGLPLLLFGVVFLVLFWHGSSQYQAALAEARELGEPLTFEELEAAGPTSPEIEAATERWLEAMAAWDRTETEDQYFKSYGGPGPNPLWDSVGAPMPDFFDQAKKDLEARGAVLESARQARESGAVASPSMTKEEWTASANILESKPFRTTDVASLLAMRAEVRAYEGDFDGAYDDLRTIVACADAHRFARLETDLDQPSYVLRSAQRALVSAIARGGLSDAQYAELDASLARLDFAQALRSLTISQRVRVIEAKNLPEFTGFPDSPRFFWVGALATHDRAIVMEAARRVLDADPTVAAIDDEVIALAKEHGFYGIGLTGDFGRFLRTPLAHTYLMGISMSVGDAEDAEAEARQLRALIAAERYRKATGAFPTKLADVVPDYLPESATAGPDRWLVECRILDGAFALLKPNRQAKASDEPEFTEVILAVPLDLGSPPEDSDPIEASSTEGASDAGTRIGNP